MSGGTSIHETLQQLSAGNREAADLLLPQVYSELRHIARRYMGRENKGHTLQTTELVHEAFLKLVGQERVEWKDRAHFRGVAAQAMRRILVDHARRRDAVKRGGGADNLPLDEVAVIPQEGDRQHHLLALDQALTRLQEEQPEKARVVEMRFFGGLTNEEIAEVLGVSDRTVHRYWKFSQAWLYREMARGSTA